MSVTTNAQQIAEHRLEIAAGDIFWAVIFYDRTTCSRCFSRMRDKDVFYPDRDGGVSKHAPEIRYRLSHDGERGYACEPCENVPDYISQSSVIPRSEYEYGYRPFVRQETYCGHCGSPNGKPVEEYTLSKHVAKDYAYTLAVRLTEAGFPTFHNDLSYYVGRFKEIRDLASHDIKIFAASTKLAIRRTRTKRPELYR